MPRRAALAMPMILALCAGLGTADARQADAGTANDITVYRCIDAQGRVALRDSPCPTGSREEVRNLTRPQPAPAPVTGTAATSPAPPSLPPAPPPPPQVIVLRTPQPMYECVTPEGSRYTSNTGDGNPRWVPLWTLGHRSRGHHGGTSRPVSRMATGAGTWVRDACHVLPQQETCARLVDRREEIRRRAFNAQETERNDLRREERGINARLSADCG